MKAPEVGASVTVLTEPVDSRVLDFRRGDRATVVAIDPPNHGRFRFTCEVERSGQRYRFAQDELLVVPSDAGYVSTVAFLLFVIFGCLAFLLVLKGAQPVVCWMNGDAMSYCDGFEAGR